MTLTCCAWCSKVFWVKIKSNFRKWILLLKFLELKSSFIGFGLDMVKHVKLSSLEFQDQDVPPDFYPILFLWKVLKQENWMLNSLWFNILFFTTFSIDKRARQTVVFWLFFSKLRINSLKSNLFAPCPNMLSQMENKEIQMFTTFSESFNIS